MNQFCPKCRKWHDTENIFCPECDSLMYDESKCDSYRENCKILKIISQSKINKIIQMGNIGDKLSKFSAIAMIVGFILGMMSEQMIFLLVVLIASIITLIIGIVLTLRSRHMYDMIQSAKKKVTYSYVTFSPVIGVSCPYCHSNNVIKIDTFDRAVSTVLVGLASGKIGKQWHCKDCDSYF